MKKSVKATIVIALIALVLLLDQSLKIWVKTTMEYGDEISLLGLDWALLHFVENNGMAFGLSLGGDYGKLVLSLFRIVAVGFLAYYIRVLLKSNIGLGLLCSFALILAGALGNIIDSAFYGLIFSESPYHGGLAQLFPPNGGYSSFLHGKVVDMLYFPMFQGFFPDWVPVWGGEHFLFFRPVFNIADVSITVGVLSIILFHRSFFKAEQKEDDDNKEGTATTDPTEAQELTTDGEATAEATVDSPEKEEAEVPTPEVSTEQEVPEEDKQES